MIDRTGQRYGRWTVLSRAPDAVPGHATWRCRCDCGGEGEVRGSILASGGSRSCGCYNLEVRVRVCKERATHGQAPRGKPTRTYRIWNGLSHRHGQAYAHVLVCDRWGKFENFLADMGECPSDLHTLDRIENRHGYNPANCRWATMKEQQNNRTNNRRIEFRGETLTLMQWAERLGTSHKTIAHRLERLGWPLEQALTLPPSPRARTAR